MDYDWIFNIKNYENIYIITFNIGFNIFINDITLDNCNNISNKISKFEHNYQIENDKEFVLSHLYLEKHCKMIRKCESNDETCKYAYSQLISKVKDKVSSLLRIKAEKLENGKQRIAKIEVMCICFFFFFFCARILKNVLINSVYCRNLKLK